MGALWRLLKSYIKPSFLMEQLYLTGLSRRLFHIRLILLFRTDACQDLYQIPHSHFTYDGLPEGQIVLYAVPINPPHPLLLEVASSLEFRDDTVHRALRYTQCVGNLFSCDLAVTSDEH
jgi:hypothetical protein